LSDGNRLAIGAEYTVKVYELDQELQPPDGNIASPNSCPHANRRVLGGWKACYHDAVLSGNGQVLVIGSSVVQNDNYDDAYNMIITTYKWNATIVDWDLMGRIREDHCLKQRPGKKNALPYQMMVLYLQYAPSLALLCTPGVWTIQLGCQDVLTWILQ